MIFVRAGWVRVVYEDAGPSFVMRPGDCVLQVSLAARDNDECAVNNKLQQQCAFSLPSISPLASATEC